MLDDTRITITTTDRSVTTDMPTLRKALRDGRGRAKGRRGDAPETAGIDHDPDQVEAFAPAETGGTAPPRAVPGDVAGVARDQLKSFVERIERLEEEKRTIADDIKDVYAEAKGNGFNVAILRQVIKIRRQDKSEREEMEALLDLYLQALGMGYGRIEG